jgi:hypothetical protein
VADRIRFYMDEHVHSAITAGLRARGVDVLTVQERGALGVSDREHMELAREDRRALSTQDADFLRLHAEGIRHAGIVYAHQGAPIGHVVRAIMLIHAVLRPEEMVDHVEFI